MDKLKINIFENKNLNNNINEIDRKIISIDFELNKNLTFNINEIDIEKFCFNNLTSIISTKKFQKQKPAVISTISSELNKLNE